MISPHLDSFIESLMAKQHITAEDAKHLHRELLPDIIPSHAVADALLLFWPWTRPSMRILPGLSFSHRSLWT